jgi:rubrerythrin
MNRSPTRKTQLLRKDVDRALFVDKLAERWLVERSIVTMYELAIRRLAEVRGLAHLTERLDRFRDQESQHAAMLEQLLRELGHEPRQEPATPGINLSASELSSLLEVLRGNELEPRHVVEVVLAAELIDNGGWDLLIELAREADLDDEWLRSFRTAGREEQEHEHVLRTELAKMEREQLFIQPGA